MTRTSPIIWRGKFWNLQGNSPLQTRRFLFKSSDDLDSRCKLTGGSHCWVLLREIETSQKLRGIHPRLAVSARDRAGRGGLNDRTNNAPASGVKKKESVKVFQNVRPSFSAQ